MTGILFDGRAASSAVNCASALAKTRSVSWDIGSGEEHDDSRKRIAASRTDFIVYAVFSTNIVKDGDNHVTKYYDENGEEIQINTGKTYITLVPADTWDSLTVK